MPARWCSWCWLLLALASITSWSIILGKRALLARAQRRGRQVRGQASGPAATWARCIAASRPRAAASGMSSIFELGFREFARLRQSGVHGRPAAGGRAARDEGGAAQGARRPRAQSGDARHHRLRQPVCGPVRHGVGHHEHLRRAGRRRSRPRWPRWRRASPRRWSPPPSRCLPPFPPSSPTTATPTRWAAWNCATTPSWKSSPPSCSVMLHGRRAADAVGKS